MKYSLFFLIVSFLFIYGCERPTDITPGNGIPPAVPTGIFVRFAQDGDILIQWDASNNLDFKQYNIYRSINKSAFIKINATTNPYFYDDSLNYSDVYSYMITAVDQSDAESSFSDTVSASPLNKLPPQQPALQMFQVNGKNVNNNLSINLTWNPNEDGDIDKYLIYRDSLNENFIPDSLNLVGTSILPQFSDTTKLTLYTKYFYKLKAMDKGGLLSKESNSESDMVLGIPKILYPANNSRVLYFTDIIINTLPVPARYKVILQTNPYFGEIWSSELSTNSINDSLKFSFNPDNIEANITYYLRVAAFSGDNPNPNSVSDLIQFVLKP